jgi:endonuclease/exonuclease/phosphatase family metal-dependent hydrolase
MNACMLTRHRPFTALALLAAGTAVAGCAPALRTYMIDRATLQCGAVLTPDGVLSPARVDWRSPKADDDALARLCDRVGPAVVAPLPRPRAVATAGTGGMDGSASGRALAPAGDTLLVVTWNTHVGAGDFRALVDTLTARSGGRLPPTVFLLQEVYRDRAARDRPGARKHDVRALADTFGLSLFYVPSMVDEGPVEDRGNAILANVPLSGLEAIELPLERQRRVVVASSVGGVRPGGGCWRVRVVSAHFDPFSTSQRDEGPARGGGDIRAMRSVFGRGRANQARALVEALGTASATVLGGDFNVMWKQRESAIRTLYASFPTGRLAPPGEATHVLRVGNIQRFDQFDYLFFRLPGAEEAPRYEKVTRSRTDSEESFFDSDHSPLLGRVPLARVAAACE